ncbi:cse1l protein [Polychytrium aggregatum]|uniref:cse1l protein n=1 Tax=Polychytrium aggregatum TaxID=110093 RepID=UPI0022FEC84B|nr:cse1l protein [Polychytrium aggregatum]KAI9208245.1 cse1l protein [Polychytrium aggregatum]
MEANEQNLAALAHYLENTLNPASRKEAEQFLAGAEANQGFPILLLRLLTVPSVAETTKFSSAVYFKNYVKKHWPNDGAPDDKIHQDDRTNIKRICVDLMIALPQKLQIQISEAIALIADCDFPDKWLDLVDILVSKLNMVDFNVNIGVLQTAHSIFKRWRSQFRSNALFADIKFVLERFAAPFLQLFQAVDSLIDSSKADEKNLRVLFEVLYLITEIFYDLNCQDLPEFFEDNHAEFMRLLHKYLVYQNPLLASSDDEAGHLEKVKTSICEIIQLYADRYADDFKTLPNFTETVCGLLAATSSEAKYDSLVSHGLFFLTTVVKATESRTLFQNVAVLQTICEKVILPNIELRDSDEELFEDDPIDYIRQDLEGSDSHTRRRAAVDLIRGLLEHFAQPVTKLFTQYIDVQIQKYNQNRQQNWKSYDSALYLTMAISAKTSSAQTGVTSVNEYMPMLPVFESQVLPELQSPTSVHPIIRVDAIKYLMDFRSQISKTHLQAVIPILLTNLSQPSYVVYTYSAVCIDRILGMRVAGNRSLFRPEDISPYVKDLLMALFGLLSRAGTSPEKIAENDYIMRAIMRITVIGSKEILPYAADILAQLSSILAVISQNPSNPKFNHYVFETVAALVKHASRGSAALVQQLEANLFGPFQAILQQDVAEFMPYVFQILSQLLDLHRGSVLPESYKSMLPPLLQHSLWESQGNVPALVSLLRSYLGIAPVLIAENGMLPHFLGVYNKLIVSKLNDQYGFELLSSLLENVPFTYFESQGFAKSTFFLLPKRLSTAKTAKFTKEFTKFLSLLFALNKPDLGADKVISVFESIQPGLFRSLFENIVIPEFTLDMLPADKRLIAVGMTTLLVNSKIFSTEPYLPLWPRTVQDLLKMLETAIFDNKPQEEEDSYIDAEDMGYQNTFTRLNVVPTQKRDPTAHLGDPKLYLAQALSSLSAQPGPVATVIQSGLSPDAVTLLQQYLGHGAQTIR